MEYTTLGNAGMSVSKIGLGCYGFGEDKDWMLGQSEATELIDTAIYEGITYFDTANRYSFGESERILGDAIAERDRERLVIGTKVYWPMNDNPNSGGLSRKTIEQELANSRERLGIDTIDLYQIHAWDYDTPIEQTLRALGDAISRGEIRSIGTCSIKAYQLAKALFTSSQQSLPTFDTLQNHYCLVHREDERELLPFSQEQGLGVMPWSPLGRGFLARPFEEVETTDRGSSGTYIQSDKQQYVRAGGEEINARVQELATEKDVSMAQISLAWLLHKEVVDMPIVGVSSEDHLREAIEAVDISLSDDQLKYLEEPYQPIPPIPER
jgi:aryl-alcohol dehydrogenase-like predicted oxidoreductase